MKLEKNITCVNLIHKRTELLLLSQENICLNTQQQTSKLTLSKYCLSAIQVAVASSRGLQLLLVNAGKHGEEAMNIDYSGYNSPML